MRIELEAALARNIPVVPVLVGHALMPGSRATARVAGAAGLSPVDRSAAGSGFSPRCDAAGDGAAADPRSDCAAEESSCGTSAQQAASAKRSGVDGWHGSSRSRGRGASRHAALAVPALRHLRQTPPPETRLDIVTPATDQPASFALSPDGRQIVFVASGDGASRLWLRSLATTTAQPLAGTEGATSVLVARQPLHRILRRGRAEAAGPRRRRSADAGSACRGGAWSTDGVILFAPEGRLR